MKINREMLSDLLFDADDYTFDTDYFTRIAEHSSLTRLYQLRAIIDENIQKVLPENAEPLCDDCLFKDTACNCRCEIVTAETFRVKK